MFFILQYSALRGSVAQSSRGHAGLAPSQWLEEGGVADDKLQALGEWKRVGFNAIHAWLRGKAHSRPWKFSTWRSVCRGLVVIVTLVSHKILQSALEKKKKVEWGDIQHQKHINTFTTFLGQLRQDLGNALNKVFAKWKGTSTDRKKVPDTAMEPAFCGKLTFREALVNLCSARNTVIPERNPVGSSRGGSVRLLALTQRWTKVLLCTYLFKVFSLSREILEQLYLGTKQWENSILSFSYSFMENSFYY